MRTIKANYIKLLFLIVLASAFTKVSGQILPGYGFFEYPAKWYVKRIIPFDSLNATVLTNNPEKIGKLYIGASPLTLTQGNVGGYGVSSKYLFNNTILISTDIIKGYTDEFGGYYFYKEHNDTLPLGRLSFSAAGNLTFYFRRVRKIKKDAELVTKYNLLAYYFAAYMVGKKSATFKNIPSDTKLGGRVGYRYSQIPIASPDIHAGLDQQGNWIRTPYLAGIAQHTLNIGICRTQIDNFIFKNDEFGVVNRSKMETFYVDFLYAMKGSFDVIEPSTGSNWKSLYLHYGETAELNQFGFRVGYERIGRYAKSKWLGAGIGFEAGMQPMIKNKDTDYEVTPSINLRQWYAGGSLTLYFVNKIEGIDPEKVKKGRKKRGKTDKFSSKSNSKKKAKKQSKKKNSYY